MLFLVFLCVAVSIAQNKVDVSEIEQRNIDGKTVIYVNEGEYNGIVYENYIVPRLKYSVKNGIKNGPYELHYKNGQINRKTSFKDDKYEGAYEEYYENGQLKIRTSFKSGKYHGALVMYYKNGQKEAEGNHVDGKFDGIQKKYYKNGQLKSSVSYQNGF